MRFEKFLISGWRLSCGLFTLTSGEDARGRFNYFKAGSYFTYIRPHQ